MTNQTEIATQARKEWMGLLARAPDDALMRLWDGIQDRPSFEWLRSPEVGGVMVRGRTGATGAPFNLGEMTTTRCSVVLQDGTVGHGYVQGRSKPKAKAAALIDAMMQTTSADELKAKLINPLRTQMQKTKTARAAKAAATKVEFFTLVRGED
ncbi:MULTISPECIES: phosphonate C-P lyase system protein PhnG [unclassified Ruegeria]|uniref:phosphonate C-P lyase system protein PhnG n=1 Tax=unclassified Ruegeria TaxID=2625375 RepID=UPI00149189D0|nr:MULTISPECIES: phosphonate C-P lyase system protein PhnG [unclassified Ruegeria]NOD89722.1 phosphonate C-P lyase system protein PhnG [Ruegeria sp. HKCCD4318]NOE14045.1 phosphonate C-P lyase system protein PhnG [Ruegeria sp. HKCCD4318-2]NOG08018.1 phosphonate C-P lyase system protein PhnG [Ruegeria sp. HKCCD4315]